MSKKVVGDSAPAFSRLEVLAGVVVVGVLALLLGLFALIRPAHVTTQQDLDFTQKGEFGYSAESRGPSPYGPSGLSVGEPIILDVLGPVKMSFAYVLRSKARSANLEGTASVTAEVKLPQGLRREFTVSDKVSFTGSETVVEGSLPVRAILRYVQNASTRVTTSPSNVATVTLQPKVRVHGSLAGHPLKAKFSPGLSFALDDGVLTVSQSANSLTSSGGSSVDTFKPSRKGKVEYDTTVSATVPLLLTELPVPAARWGGLGVAGACLLMGVWVARPLMRGDDPANEPGRIRVLYGSHLIEVAHLSLRGRPIARVGSIDSLVDLAKKYESKIMHVAGPDGDSYSVWDNGLLYEYRPGGSGDLNELQGQHADLPVVNGSKSIVNGNRSPHKARN